MANIYHQVLIEADKATVYEAVTTQKGIAGWWIADCEVKPEVGFINTFKAGEGIYNKMEVTALEPDSFVSWRCVNKNDEWSGTLLTFTLSTKGSFTCLDFKHTGYAAEDELYATCNYHWARHLGMLKEFCETGQPQLNPEREKKEVKAVHGPEA
ncbi:SRPBCC family protein [Nafulsella turpanensis]|uniref:SRPBCC family protein n=1 Tax=Nafulsella turpanensis TaxID=1265690 RepID=UPI0003485AE6|nr:SRPBCC domain-containing protein [Nafulsella turpanensis]